MPKKYYITTPIYYVNSAPHIGTALTTLVSDILARYQTMRGNQAHFLTGTDENAIKVAEAAQSAGKDPKAFVDEISAEFIKVWAGMNIRYHDFIRTTEDRHIKVVHEIFKRLLDSGYIYTAPYEGWYDVSSETFYKEEDLIDGKSPDGNPVRWVSEENYFFKLSAFSEKLLTHIKNNPNFILPETRKNEVVAFINRGLQDICISRKNAGWGIPVPNDPERVVYVWFDALINYLSAINWPDGNWQDFWPPQVQWMGKEILVRFHATLWPAMLMALDLSMPESLVGHGWILMGDEKISKSKGNIIRPLELADELSQRTGASFDLIIDALRFHMAHILPFESDSRFTVEDFELKYNTEIVNDLSNGIHRVMSMINNFCDGKIPDAKLIDEVVNQTRNSIRKYEDAMQRFRIEQAIDQILHIASILNMMIDREKPWELRKNNDERLGEVMRTLAWLVRVLEGVLRPVAPSFADKISALLQLPPTENWVDIGGADAVPVNHTVAKPDAIYPRLEKKHQETKTEIKQQGNDNMITIEDFQKLELRIARVLDAHKVEGADKLLRLELVVGGEKRQVLAGIAQDYSPESLIGRQVVLLANLQPRKLRGYESQGMVLAADGPNGEAILLMPDKEAPEGTTVH